MRKLAVFLVLFIVVLIPVMPVYAWPSSDFYEEGDAIFDVWHVCRTNGCGEDGFLQVKATETRVSFRPVIAFESLGEYTDTAYRLGEQFAEKYPDRHQRAEKIFEYVRNRIQYVTDIDQWDIDEYAQNADEVANILQEEGTTYADCEEFAALLAVMYQGAGFRSAIVVCFDPGHAAVLVCLPDYQKANVQFNLEGEPGWVWAEATGKTNQFGWFPEGQIEGPILGYEISSDEHIALWHPPEEEELLTEPEEELPTEPEEELPTEPEEELPTEPPVTGGGPNFVVMALPLLIVVIVLMGIILLFRRRRRA